MEPGDLEIETLIVKSLNGTLSAEEKTRFDELLIKNNQAQKHFDDLSKLWKTSGSLTLQQGLSRDVRWHNLKEKMEKDPSGDSRFSLKLILRYAAVLVGISLVAALYLYLPSDNAIVEIKTAYGETRAFVLPDESLVTLNAGTSLQYDPASWDEERKLELTGEAFFEVIKSDVPFIVASNNANVHVMGTSFNVRSRNSVTSVTCVTGKVNVSKKTNGNQSAVLTQGLGVTVDSLVLSDVYHVADNKVIGWMQGDLHFDNTPLDEVFSEIERHFNKSMILKKETGSQTFTGWFKEPQLDNILSTVCLSAGLKYSIRPDSVIVIQ